MAKPNPHQPKQPDYYKVLDVDFNATADEVSKAFRQRALQVHPDKQASANVNDWHVLHKAYTTLMESIQRDNYEKKLASDHMQRQCDCTSSAGVKMSEKLKQRFDQWMQVNPHNDFGSFHKAFHLELRKMLNEKVNDKSKLFEMKKKTNSNFEDMLSSIAVAANENVSSPIVKEVTKHLVRILRAAQVNSQCSKPKVTNGCVPIIDLSGSPVNDLLFLLNLFTSVDDLPHKSENIEKHLLVYVPVTHVDEGMLLKENPNKQCLHCTANLSNTVCCASCYHRSVSVLKVESKCPNCAASLPTVLNKCYSCKNYSCIKCPLGSMKAPRIGVNSPRPICQQCKNKLAIKDAKDWVERACHLMQSRAEGYLKPAMACVLIAIHTTEDLQIPQLRDVASEFLKHGFHEQALLILSVIREVSSKHDLKLYLPIIKALLEISGKPGKSCRERWLLTLATKQATHLANESAANDINPPDLLRVHDKIIKSITDDKCEKETKYNMQVNTSLCELEKAWVSRDITEMLNIITSTEVTDDIIILENGIKPAVRALDIFLDARRKDIPRMPPNDQYTVQFLEGYALICCSKVQKGLGFIERAIWSGHHSHLILEAAVPLVLAHPTMHPSIKNDVVKVGEEILKTGPAEKLCFTSLLHLLGITQEDLNPCIKSCWPEFSVPGVNKAATRMYEISILQQVQEGKLNYSEAGFALIDFNQRACHPSEKVICFLNASLWFLKDLRSKPAEDLQWVNALKNMSLTCVEEAYSVACLTLHPGMQFYTLRFGLAVATEAITASGVCATTSDAKMLVGLFRSVIQKGRLSPFWNMPFVPVCEAVMLNILTGRLHTEFMLHLQKDHNSGILTKEEIEYQLYENDIRLLCPVKDKDATRECAMEALLQTKGLSWTDVSSSMCSVLTPRTPDGWLLQQENLEGNLPFATLKGFEFNMDPNNTSVKLNVVPAECTKNGLFSEEDIQTVLQIPKKNLCPIAFSLDPPSDSHCFHPFQQLRFEPAFLKDTNILHTLFQADYLMKCFAVGSDVSAKPPFRQRDCSEGLTAKLPPHLKKVLAQLAEKKISENKTCRLWIEVDEIEFNATSNGSLHQYRMGAVKMVIRTSPQFHGLDEKLHDVKEKDSGSVESKFAQDLTEYYDEISKYFPIFARLKELCKLQMFAFFLRYEHETLSSIVNRDCISIPANVLHDIETKRKELESSTEQMLGKARKIVGILPGDQNSPTHHDARVDSNYSYWTVILCEIKRKIEGVLKHRMEQHIVDWLTSEFSKVLEGQSNQDLHQCVHSWLFYDSQDLKNLLISTKLKYEHLQKKKCYDTLDRIIPCEKAHVPSQSCVWVPAAVKVQNKGNFRTSYGGVCLVPKPIECGSIPKVTNETTYNICQLQHENHMTTTHCHPFSAKEKVLTMQNNSTSHCCVISSKQNQLQSKTTRVLEMPMNEATKKANSHLNRVLSTVEGGSHGNGNSQSWQDGGAKNADSGNRAGGGTEYEGTVKEWRGSERRTVVEIGGKMGGGTEYEGRVEEWKGSGSRTLDEIGGKVGRERENGSMAEEWKEVGDRMVDEGGGRVGATQPENEGSVLEAVRSIMGRGWKKCRGKMETECTDKTEEQWTECRDRMKEDWKQGGDKTGEGCRETARTVKEEWKGNVGTENGCSVGDKLREHTARLEEWGGGGGGMTKVRGSRVGEKLRESIGRQEEWRSGGGGMTEVAGDRVGEKLREKGGSLEEWRDGGSELVEVNGGRVQGEGRDTMGGELTVSEGLKDHIKMGMYWNGTDSRRRQKQQRRKQGDDEDSQKNHDKLWITKAFLLSAFLQHSHENKRSPCHQVQEATEEDQRKASDMLKVISIPNDPWKEERFRKEQQQQGEVLDRMHVTHKVGFDLLKYILIKIDGKELTEKDIEVIRECYNRFENFELVSQQVNPTHYVIINNTLKEAINECLKNGRVSEATWKSLSGQHRVRQVVMCLKRDYWPPVVSQRVQILRDIVNPRNPTQNLWDM